MDMSLVSFTLIFLVIVALAFDFMNGMHDTANSIATVVSTRVLKPQHAVIWAAFFNFAAYYIGTYFGFEAKVASTIGKGLIAPELVTNAVVFGALMGALIWNILTWWFGIPSSSSHALVGGIIGAGVAKAGINGIVWSGLSKTLYAIVLSPVTGFVLAVLIMILLSWLFVRAHPAFADRASRYLQLLTAALYSIGHGSNDAQKTAGVISVLLLANGYDKEFTVHNWVIFSCFAVMGLGTLMGGWSIIKTVGSKITKITPMQGAAAQTGGAITLFLATAYGVPVSTTHTITSAVMGAGAARRVSAVRWGIAGRIVYAWIITIPAAAILAAMFFWIGSLFM